MTTLERVRAEIQKVLDKERDFTSENAKAQAIALNWVLALFDKYAEQEPCDDVVSRQAVLDMVEDMTDQFGNKHRVVTEGMISLLPPVTPKPKTECSCEQIKWERDTAIAQLKELGYGLGEKPKTGHWIMDRLLERRTCDNCNTEYRWSFFRIIIAHRADAEWFSHRKGAKHDKVVGIPKALLQASIGIS